MSRASRISFAGLATAVLAVGAGACAAPVLDAGRVAQAVRDQAKGVELADVVCPPDVAAAAGATFECVATGADGTRVVVTVTQRDDAGDVTISYGRGMVDTSSVAAMLDAEVEATLEAEVELRCPAAVLLPDATGSFTCSGVDEGGDRFEIAVRVADGAVAPDAWDLVR